MKTLHLFFALWILLPLWAGAYTNLSVNDPRNGGVWGNGVIESASVTIDPQGDYFYYDLQLKLAAGELKDRASDGDSLEIVCNFDLPAGAFIKSSALLIDGVWTDAALMPRSEAHAIYEGVVKRRRDPLIIYKNYGDNYQFKIFPLVYGQSREMKLRYAIPAGSAKGNKTAMLPWDMLNASEVTPDLDVVVKQSEDFADPSVIGGGVEFTEMADGSLGASIPSETVGLSPEMTSTTENGSIQFAYSRGSDGIAYRLSFVPNEVFNLEDNTKMLFIIDNSPELIVDSTWNYIYKDEMGEYEREYIGYKIKPVPNDKIAEQLTMFLSKQTEKDSFNIIIKNNGVYVHSDEWLPATAANISAAASALTANSTAYKADMKSLMKTAAPWINEHRTISVVLSNNQEFRRDQYSEAREYAAEIVAEAGIEQPVDGIDISSVQIEGTSNGEQYYYYSRLLSYLINETALPNSYTYSRHLYNLKDMLTVITSLETKQASRIILPNIETASDNGLVYDKSANSIQNALPTVRYTELGKITEGTEFSASVAFRYKGKPYFDKFTFPIGDEVNEFVEDGWAVKLIDQINNTSDPDARRIAEELSSKHHVLTRNTSFLSIDPDAEVTPCYDCPDWQSGGGRLVWGEDMMVNDIMAVDGAMEVGTFEEGGMNEQFVIDDGVDASSYSNGYYAGAAIAEENCLTSSQDLYNLGYEEGFNQGKTEVAQAVNAVSVPEFTVSPNPFTEKLEIALASGESAIVEIVDAAGRIVYTKEFDGAVTIDVTDKAFALIPSGIYVVKVTVGDDEYSQVVTKE